jgi:hypothetical protein
MLGTSGSAQIALSVMPDSIMSQMCFAVSWLNGVSGLPNLFSMVSMGNWKKVLAKCFFLWLPSAAARMQYD